MPEMFVFRWRLRDFAASLRTAKRRQSTTLSRNGEEARAAPRSVLVQRAERKRGCSVKFPASNGRVLPPAVGGRAWHACSCRPRCRPPVPRSHIPGRCAQGFRPLAHHWRVVLPTPSFSATPSSVGHDLSSPRVRGDGAAHPMSVRDMQPDFWRGQRTAPPYESASS